MLILAGLFALFGVVIPNAWSIALVIFGLLIIIASLTGYRPRLPALAILLIGLVAFGVTSSGYVATAPSRTIKSYSLTTEQARVEKLSLTCTVTTGNIHLSFTSDRTLIYNVAFTQQYFQPAPTPEIEFKNTTSDRKLTIDASTTTARAR